MLRVAPAPRLPKGRPRRVAVVPCRGTDRDLKLLLGVCSTSASLPSSIGATCDGPGFSPSDVTPSPDSSSSPAVSVLWLLRSSSMSMSRSSSSSSSSMPASFSV
uniref:(northern house mosquito) hypothetical protein n=1 Tax=Culex pipiens TaxID=7175 RepID=A0A8D8E6K4_CULPI